MDGHFVELPGVRLWYLDTGGTGVPVVLLHANTGTSESWEPQLASFARAGFRVVAFDGRGCGRSEPLAETGDQPGSMAADLDALADVLGLGRFHLVGVARGGFTALDYAAWRPTRLSRVVVGASIGLPDEAEIADFLSAARITAIQGPAHAAELELSAGYRGENPAGVRRWLAIEEHAHQPGHSGQPLRTPNTYAKLETIDVPLLAIAGGADLIAPPALMRRWVAHVPRAEFAVLPEAGHGISWENPEAFDDLVLEFLSRPS